MKKKYSTKPVRRSLGKGGSTLARRSLGEGGFFNLRALLGLTLCLFGVALAIFAARERAAAAQHARMMSGVPAGPHQKLNLGGPVPLGYGGFTALGPQPERMT